MPKFKIFTVQRLLLAYIASFLTFYFWILLDREYQYNSNDTIELIIINTFLAYIVAIVVEFIVLKLKKKI